MDTTVSPNNILLNRASGVGGRRLGFGDSGSGELEIGVYGLVGV